MFTYVIDTSQATGSLSNLNGGLDALEMYKPGAHRAWLGAPNDRWPHAPSES